MTLGILVGDHLWEFSVAIYYGAEWNEAAGYATTMGGWTEVAKAAFQATLLSLVLRIG